MPAIDPKTPMRTGQYRRHFGIGKSLMSAINRALHPELPAHTRVQWVTPADVHKFLRANPSFGVSTIYPRKKNANAEVSGRRQAPPNT